MAFQKEALDLVLVPSGLVLMFSYHLFLLYRCLHLPHTTVIGYEKNDMRAWVDKVMQVRSILSKQEKKKTIAVEVWPEFVIFIE